MNDKKTTLEVIAPDMDEAIEKGLDQLGLPRDAVKIEVLDDGQGGFLGIGNRQVRVRLTLLDLEQEKEPTEEIEALDEELGEFTDEFDEAKERALLIVKKLLSRMKIKATVTARIMEPEDEHDEQMVIVEITGKDLSILIGRRAETLNALQYITSLMLKQQLNNWIPLIIDVQGYRFRRLRLAENKL